MKHVTAGGLGVAYVEAGEGMPVLLVHGFPHSHELWTSQLAHFARKSRCIAPDLRGFGGTDGKAPWTIDQYADDMAALLDALNVERAVVAGLSMGGYVALSMWKRHSERVRALILADTRAGADDEEGRKKRDKLIELAQREGARAIADAQIEGMLGKSSRAASPGLVRNVHEMLAAAPVAGIVGALQAMRDRHDSTEILGGISVPTLIVVGDEDVLTPPKEARRMHDEIPGSRLEIIAGAGHLSNVEKPQEFNRITGEFLDGLADLANS